MPWRWALVGGIGLLGLFFLVLQLLVGVGVERQGRADLDRALAGKEQEAHSTLDLKRVALIRGTGLMLLNRTTVLTLVALLHLVAVACSGLVFRADFHRSRPIPRIDVLW
jgi:hypothetical protein